MLVQKFFFINETLKTKKKKKKKKKKNNARFSFTYIYDWSTENKKFITQSSSVLFTKCNISPFFFYKDGYNRQVLIDGFSKCDKISGPCKHDFGIFDKFL
jgi:hypothetical protein